MRELLSYLPSSNREPAPRLDITDTPDRLVEHFNGFVPDDPKKPYDIYQIIQGLADHGKYYDVMPLFARNIATCFIRLNGRSVGVIANQPLFMAGCLDINSSDKAARFIRFCDAFRIPLLTLVDVPGFLPEWNRRRGGSSVTGRNALCVLRGNRTEGNHGSQKSLRRRLYCNVQPGPGGDINFCLAHGPNCRDGRGGSCGYRFFKRD